MYLQLKSLDRSTNVFEWWTVNEPRFPNISKLAKSMLCVPAISTAAERVCSAARNTIKKEVA